LQQIGINKITDISKLIDNQLNLPNLTQLTELNQSTPLASLSDSSKDKIPTNILFAKTFNGLIDFNATLSLTEQGHPQQQITTLVGQQLRLIIKPDNPARAIRGYLIFKQQKSISKNPNTINPSAFTASLTQQEIDVTARSQQTTDLKQALVLGVFDFTDPDQDSIWTADITTPVVDATYEILTVIDYLDQRLEPKELSLVTVVDPEGYVYETTDRGELRINNAKVSIYWLNPEANSYQLWLAKDFQQQNPQITNTTGKYSFLVPEGTYYLKAEASGYTTYKGDVFEVKTENGVHLNLELKAQDAWSKFFDWKTITLIVVLLFLSYNFYKDRKLKIEIKNLKK